jgi:hypothetical protein
VVRVPRSVFRHLLSEWPTPGRGIDPYHRRRLSDSTWHPARSLELKRSVELEVLQTACLLLGLDPLYGLPQTVEDAPDTLHVS